ncbi:hypothetical protein HHK36_026671 [Tetracentron sinense]|uniref:RING-type E3 ubiquitin transferase n=1 Tax=Tetracentron sinense TaxID=13715 RepID=A0A834YK24_TETSI|nr:hypothetical protein HHK36_026671 [Tetracentron sinense]
MMGPPNSGGYNPPFNANQSDDGWSGIRPPVVPMQPPPPYVGHQNANAKKVRNGVNVNKESIRVEVDKNNPDCHLVSFTFDAMVDGSITIFYFGKEEPNCRFTPLYPEVYMPVRIPFQRGLGQKFCQPSGIGIDLGFFELGDLSQPSLGEDVFPLVISAETQLGHAQITQAVLEKNNGAPFQVRVIRQILWVDAVRYELREIYGIHNSAEADFDSNDPGKDECAKALRLQSNNCPICRQPIQELLEIRLNEVEEDTIMVKTLIALPLAAYIPMARVKETKGPRINLFLLSRAALQTGTSDPGGPLVTVSSRPQL